MPRRRAFRIAAHRLYPPLALTAVTLCGLCVVAIQVMAARGGVSILFPGLILTMIFIYFMGGLIFYHALAANVIVMSRLPCRGHASLQLPDREFGYNALAIVAANLFCASVVYMHEKTSRMRFLEACLLREMVARDGLTGIQNRRMFDQHIQRVWQQAVREEERIAVLLVDIDCFKDYNDRYGHQAGDECLRAVAVSLSQCARRPLDFVARYGGEEFAVVLYEASREYVAEVLTRIQRSIAELNIPHEASRVASRLTVSIGAAFILPGCQSHAGRADSTRGRGPVQRQGTGQEPGRRHGGRIPDADGPAASRSAAFSARSRSRFQTGFRRPDRSPRPVVRRPFGWRETFPRS